MTFLLINLVDEIIDLYIFSEALTLKTKQTNAVWIPCWLESSVASNVY